MNQSLITYFFISLFSLSCTSQNNGKNLPPGAELKKQVVVDSTKETATVSIADSNVVNCILISSDSLYCYRGTDLQKGVFYSISGTNQYRTYIQKIKKTVGKNLVIVIKPTQQCSYKTTVDVLDEMTINGIKNYAMVKLSSTEKAFLQKEDFSWDPPEPVEIKTPQSTTSQSIEGKIPYLLLTLTENKTIFYEFKNSEISSGKKQIIPFSADNIAKMLGEIEADYKISLKEVSILVYGHPKSRYPEFEKLINGLKKKELYKYNLITSIEQ